MLRMPIILVLGLMLLSGSAYALAGTGPIVVDIVGSETNNTKVMSSGMEKVELEFVGSTANNTIIGLPAEEVIIHQHHACDDENSIDECSDKKKYPWEGMHLGVDAWYGTFWYTDINMPKWPQF